MSSLDLDVKPVLLPPDTCHFFYPLFAPHVPYLSSNQPRLSQLTRLTLASGLKYFLPHLPLTSRSTLPLDLDGVVLQLEPFQLKTQS